MFILMIILTAFLCGLNNIYVPYQETERLGKYAGPGMGCGAGRLAPCSSEPEMNALALPLHPSFTHSISQFSYFLMLSFILTFIHFLIYAFIC